VKAPGAKFFPGPLLPSCHLLSSLSGASHPLSQGARVLLPPKSDIQSKNQWNLPVTFCFGPGHQEILCSSDRIHVILIPEDLAPHSGERNAAQRGQEESGQACLAVPLGQLLLDHRFCPSPSLHSCPCSVKSKHKMPGSLGLQPEVSSLMYNIEQINLLSCSLASLSSVLGMPTVTLYDG
jgi:hypothetical protein